MFLSPQGSTWPPAQCSPSLPHPQSLSLQPALSQCHDCQSLALVQTCCSHLCPHQVYIDTLGRAGSAVQPSLYTPSTVYRPPALLSTPGLSPRPLLPEAPSSGQGQGGQREAGGRGQGWADRGRGRGQEHNGKEMSFEEKCLGQGSASLQPAV